MACGHDLFRWDRDLLLSVCAALLVDTAVHLLQASTLASVTQQLMVQHAVSPTAQQTSTADLQILQDCLQAPAGRQAAEGPSAAGRDNVYRLLVATGQKIAGDFALTQVTPRDMNCQGQVSHHWWLLYCCCCTAAAVLLLLYCCCCTAAACQLPGHWVMMGSSPAGAVPCAAGLLFFCIMLMASFTGGGGAPNRSRS